MRAFIIDRRKNPGGKSLPNQQRFKRRVKEAIREAVKRSISDMPIKDVGQKNLDVRTKSTREPQFHHDPKQGNHDHVLPGNKKHVPGDTIPKPPDEGGVQGFSGDGEDDFAFAVSPEEYLALLFEELELPNMEQMALGAMEEYKWVREGLSTSGSPSNLNYLHSLRRAKGRHIALNRPKAKDMAKLEEEIALLKSLETPDEGTHDKLLDLEAQLGRMRQKLRIVPWMDPVDLRYNRFAPKPLPVLQAVMFCLMDVSGSMNEDRKDLAKRFFIMLHLFLGRHYKKIDIVFIRHTEDADEVDEHTFFYDRGAGGTAVSSALEKMRDIVEERYPPEAWNIFAAQASDGDNAKSDQEKTLDLLEDSILPIVRFFSYIETREGDNNPNARKRNQSDLMKLYARYLSQNPKAATKFAMKRVRTKEEIFPALHGLFNKNRQAQTATLGAG